MKARRAEYCAFCGLHEVDVARLFQGPGLVAICNDCVMLMHAALVDTSVVRVSFGAAMKDKKT